MLRRGFDPKLPFDPEARNRAIQHMGGQLRQLEEARMNRSRAMGIDAPELSTTSWTPIGPAPLPLGQTETRSDQVNGRVISIAIHPTNPSIVFVGTASGGLYRTLNGQAANPTWTSLMDTIQLQSNGLSALGTLAIGVIAIAPSNPNIVYIGTGEQNTGYFGSGLYRIDNATTVNPTLVGPINPSANYGDGFVTPTFTYRAISQILVHPTIPGTIFVSTADGIGGLISHNDSAPPVPTGAGIRGIYRSNVAANPANSVSFSKLKINTQNNLATGDTDVSDMVLDPSDATANTLIAWVRSGAGKDTGCTAGNNCAGVYRTTNAQSANAAFTQQLISLDGSVRGQFAINKVGTVVTVLAATEEDPADPANSNPNNCASGQVGLLRRSVDGGITWSSTDATTAAQGGLLRAADGFCGTQCGYDIGLAMDPTNANIIQIGGNSRGAPIPNFNQCQSLTKRSTDGVTMTANSTGLHADVHAFAVSKSNPTIVWTGNDGGVWRSTDSGATWSSMNGDPASTTNPTGKISATQYISIATHPVDREFMIGGTQDNGTHLKRAFGDTGEWAQVALGDGGYTAIDQNATDTSDVRMYHTFFNSVRNTPHLITYQVVTTTADALAKNWTNVPCVAGGANFTHIDCNDTAVSFFAPMALGPGDPNALYFGTDRLYRSGDGGQHMNLCSQAPIVAAGKVEITSISAAWGNDQVVMVGMRDGSVWATTTGAFNFVNVTPPGAPVGVTVGKVMVDPNNTDPNAITAYIGYGGFGTAAAPITHVWKTTNLAGGAATWVPMSTGLPDVPIDAIVIDRRSAVAPAAGTSIYLGTDIGVYQSTNGGANWAIFNPGNTLPVLPVFDMAFQEQIGVGNPNRILRIATHGRGIWEIQIGNAPTPTPTPSPTPGSSPTPASSPTPTATATATATPVPAGLVGNVSTRLPVGTNENVLIEGFIVQGPAGSTKKIMVRAIGPSLIPFGITDALANPTLEIHDASNLIVATNDNWKTTQVGGLITGDQVAEITASQVAPSNDLESAIIADLPPGSYTAVVSGVGNTVGTGVVDAYDLSPASPAKLANIATRGLIQPGDKLMIAGFIVQVAPVKAVIRAVGPSLAPFGITNALADTTLQLRDANGAIVRENDDWKTDQQQELINTGLQPSDDREAALVQTISPGQYTAQVRGKPETTGIGVVQVYFLDE